jgi:hypothetical protein
MMPEGVREFRLRARTAGMGSLGRARFCVVSDWQGAPIAREAKAVAPSACVWAAGDDGKKPAPVRIEEAIRGAVRAHDPTYRIVDGWVVRRLAPDCEKILLRAVARVGDESRMLRAMGRETANAQAGDDKAFRAVQKDLEKRPGKWLSGCARAAAAATVEDWEQWREEWKE